MGRGSACVKPVVAIIAPGSMGAAVGQRLAQSGLEILTSLAGRSTATRERAIAAGFRDVPERELMRADLFLSIVPPGAALPLAERITSRAAPLDRRPVFVDCNAVSPETAGQIAARVVAAGFEFADAGIIGGPPQAGSSGPNIYVSGAQAPRVHVLADFGLRIRVLDAPVGAASALKMAYAGITKGLIAVGSSMILAARRAGVAEALHAELAESQQNLLRSFGMTIPAMYRKAYRWVAEMEEIAAFAGADAAAAAIYAGAAMLYERLARDVDKDRAETGELSAFLEQSDADIPGRPVVVTARQP
jgi:putative dehydrogenase